MKKKYAGLVLVLLLLIPIGIYAFINTQTFILKIDEITFEYGEEVQLDLKEIIETDNPQILENIVIDLSGIPLEDSQKYPETGEYTIYINYVGLFRKQSSSIKIIIDDTTKPNFVEAPETIKIKANESDFDFNSYFEIEN